MLIALLVLVYPASFQAGWTALRRLAEAGKRKLEPKHTLQEKES